MTISTTKQTSSKTRSVPRDCSGEECASGARNNYFLGKPMTPESHRLEQSYGIKRRRLINRAIHGWGVVYGFALRTAEDGKHEPEPGGLSIGEGLALDRLGRELIQTRGVGLTLDNFLVLDRQGQPVRIDGDLDQRFAELGRLEEKCWLLRVHYAEQKVGPLSFKDPCNGKRKEWERTCETVVYSLQPIDCGKCCIPYECALRCCCPDSPCCAEDDPGQEDLSSRRETLEAKGREELRAAGGDEDKVAEIKRRLEAELADLERGRAPAERKALPRGGCSCLCEHLADLEIGGDDCAALKYVDGCTRADLAHGVALACLKLDRDRCDDWTVTAIHDACGPRRLVKRNDLLFDLINGCDLTRIEETGWSRWHRRKQAAPFEEFLAALGWDGEPGFQGYPTRDFWVRFSRPVRTDTLTPEVFAMVVTSDHGDDFWRRSYRVPIIAIETDAADSGGVSQRARIVVSGDWLENAAGDRDTLFDMGATRVEIEVRGDLVRDCLGQTVDANSWGRSPIPSGNGTPGDSYVSSFTVEARRRGKPKEERQARRPWPNSTQAS